MCLLLAAPWVGHHGVVVAGYKMYTMRQSDCQDVNRTNVNRYGVLFNYTTVGQISEDSWPLPFIVSWMSCGC